MFTRVRCVIITFLLDSYDRLIEAITGLFSKDWRKHLQFLIPLVIGAGIAIFSLSHVMDGLLTNYNRATFYFFIGLIIGTLPYLFRESELQENLENKKYVAVLIVGIILINLLPLEPTEDR